MAEKEGLERVTTRYIPTSRTSILYNHAFLYNYIQDVMKHIILAAALALATAALQELGYSPAEISLALKGVDPQASTEDMVRRALRAMVMKG